MKNAEITWRGVLKGTLFTFVFFVGLGILTSFYLLFFVHFDGIESIGEAVQRFFQIFTASIENAFLILMEICFIIFFTLVGLKISLDFVAYIRARKAE